MRFRRNEVEAFAVRLAAARAAAGLPRRELVDRVDGVSEPQQVYNYEKARRVPERIEVILGLEEALALDPGTLCRLLGFVPLGVDPPMPTVEDAIATDSRLTTEAREQLLGAYRRLRR